MAWRLGRAVQFYLVRNCLAFILRSEATKNPASRGLFGIPSQAASGAWARWVWCIGPLGLVHRPVGFGAWARWVWCVGPLGLVRGPVGFGAWARWVWCMGPLGLVRGPVGFGAWARWVWRVGPGPTAWRPRRIVERMGQGQSGNSPRSSTLTWASRCWSGSGMRTVTAKGMTKRADSLASSRVRVSASFWRSP
jgi:hypothetical protein